MPSIYNGISGSALYAHRSQPTILFIMITIVRVGYGWLDRGKGSLYTVANTTQFH